jgi:hypothetical protein
VKKQVRNRAGKRSVGALAENESTQPTRKTVVDARAELLRSTSAEASVSTRLAPEFKVVDAVPALGAETAASLPTEKLATDRLAPDYRTERRLDLETLMAAAPTPRGEVAAPGPTAAPAILAITDTVDDGPGRMATWLGVLLVALGLASVFGSSRAIREGPGVTRLMRGRASASAARPINVRSCQAKCSDSSGMPGFGMRMAVHSTNCTLNSSHH